ncbi:MAG: multicopper oxidase domain-containing protein, partial [Mycobacterium sp.]
MPALPTSGVPFGSPQLTRRGFIAAGIAGGFALAGCGQTSTSATSSSAQMAAAIAAAEAARSHSGHTVTARLTAQRTQIDLGGPIVHTLAYGDTIPGPLIRANIGDELAVTVSNRLDSPTSLHWHGIALRNDMDGAAPATPNIDAGQDFTYRFSAPDSGTYWGHPHVGLEEDMGLYLPVIIDNPHDSGYDAEWIVIMDDWTDGVGKSPQQLYDELTAPKSSAPNVPQTPSTTTTPSTRTRTPPRTRTPATPIAPKTPPTSTTGMPGMPKPADTVGISKLLGGYAGDIAYPYYLINGRIPSAPTTFNAKPGQRIRIRFINTGSDTAFRVALDGHSMTVTHTDGYPVVPTEVDALLIGMAERYDVIVTADDGVFPLVALAEGKNALA